MTERKVDRITKDMVGTEVFLNNQWHVIEHVGKMYLMTEDGLSFNVNTDRMIRDPKEVEKLPSDRIHDGEYIETILDELWKRGAK